MLTIKSYIVLVIIGFNFLSANAQKEVKPAFKVVGFYTGVNDMAHVSYVHEANKWLAKMAQQHNFVYDSTANWDNLNAKFLAKYQVVYFLIPALKSRNSATPFKSIWKVEVAG